MFLSGFDDLGVGLPVAEGSKFIKVHSEQDWSIEILPSADADSEDEEENVDWLKIAARVGDKPQAKITGSGSGSILLQWEKNAQEQVRTCCLVMTDAKGNRSVSHVSQNSSVFKSDKVCNWMELPKVETSKTRYFVSHDMITTGTKQCRNYSFLLDTDAKIALWVAYPLNRGLIGANTGRTNDWGLDPKVPAEYQPVILRSFSGYQRGHQLPSADRYGKNNSSTFYGTNMTPQKGVLNEEAWQLMEAMVREWSYQFDTLYVVTGADINGSTVKVKDNNYYYVEKGTSYSKDITVPVGYFKALLGYKKTGTIADTGENGGYTGIAFYFEHKEYEKTRETIMSRSMSIDELERKLGYDFFPDLVNRTSSADYIESNVHSWWK